MAALAYADEIPISYPSRRGLPKMLVLSNNFENENYIIFNTKNTLYVKYWDLLMIMNIYIIKLDWLRLFVHWFDTWRFFSDVL